MFLSVVQYTELNEEKVTLRIHLGATFKVLTSICLNQIASLNEPIPEAKMALDTLDIKSDSERQH